MMFMEAKNLYTSVRDVKHHGWNKPTGREIYGKKLGIIGFGMIGKYLAEYAYGCGMEVYAYDAFAIAEETARQYHAQISTLEDILTDCDYISLHVPLLESTRNKMCIRDSGYRLRHYPASIPSDACCGLYDAASLGNSLLLPFHNQWDCDFPGNT